MKPPRPIGDDDLQAVVDGRVAPERRPEIESYLTDNSAAAAHVVAMRNDLASLRDALAAKAKEPVPPHLRVSHILAERRRTSRGLYGAAAVILLVLCGAAGWVARGVLQPQRPATVQVLNEGLAAYRTFVAETAHPVEVPAAQETHLVQWLSKRLRQPVTAPDLTRYGYRLFGGRLLPGSDDVGAQLMYETAEGQRLTLYVRAGETGTTAFRYSRDGELSTFYWLDRGLGFVLTAQTTPERLTPIAEAVYRHVEAQPAH